MVTATLNGTVVAASDNTVVVEGNHYFPIEDVVGDVLQQNDRQSRCFWKGDASYFDVVVDGESSAAEAWTYADPLPKAETLKGRVAFWKGVEITDAAR
ncbi:MAG: DUF427 domain-containing protein [Microthrixaceae bacterium]